MTARGQEDGEVALDGGLNPSVHPPGLVRHVPLHRRMLCAEC